MASPHAEQSLIPLRLHSKEQWLLHHVLFDRIEAGRRSPETVAPAPVEVNHAFAKVEAGNFLFTVPELRRARQALEAYRRRPDVPDRETRDVRKIVERVDAALSGGGGRSPE